MNMQPVYFEKQNLCITSCQTKDQQEHLASTGNHPFRMRDGFGKWITVNMCSAVLVSQWLDGAHSYFAWKIKPND